MYSIYVSCCLVGVINDDDICDSRLTDRLGAADWCCQESDCV